MPEEHTTPQAPQFAGLTLHARGASMKSKTVALLLSDLGVTKTHSRPHVSDGNPFSENQSPPPQKKIPARLPRPPRLHR